MDTTALIISMAVGITILLAFLWRIGLWVGARVGEWLAAPVKDLDSKLDTLSVDLRDHMATEEAQQVDEKATIEKIETLIRKTRDEVLGARGDMAQAEERNVLAHIQVIKSGERQSSIPTTIFSFVDGKFGYLWGNLAYLNMTGLTQAEAEADLVWEGVHEADAAILQQTAEAMAEKRHVIEVSWRAVDPHTKVETGIVHSVAEFLPGSTDDEYYYIAQYDFTPPAAPTP